MRYGIPRGWLHLRGVFMRSPVYGRLLFHSMRAERRAGKEFISGGR